MQLCFHLGDFLSWVALLSLLSQLTFFFVMTLTLDLRPRQRHSKVHAENATQESHSHSRKCEKVWGNEPTHSRVDSHFGSWSPYGLLNFQKTIWKAKIHWIDTIEKFLRRRYLKWACMIHLSIYNTSYGWNKS
jgi:hypothetical protein